MYWWKLYKDIKLWRKFSKISKSSRKKLEEYDLRVDMLGRIYTVVNLPEEVSNGNEYMHEAWVLQNLGPYNKALEQVGLAGYVFPEMRKIEEPGTSAYLLVLYPEVDSLSFLRFILNLLLWTGGFFILRFAFRITSEYVDYGSIGDWISKYLF
tara:strand:+ start:11994 stop:12452 length:459 start_codon:yes stop_codon:yes gene_type:complete